MSAKLSEMQPLDIPTSAGPARAHFAAGERAALVLGHGAGGGVGAPDLVAAAEAATAAGCAVALVEQPYRVAGKRSSPRPPALDAAWTEVVAGLPLDGLALIAGGRSAGARVACRTAAATGAAAVLCLAFPLRPPRGGQSRQEELDAVSVPTLVVQGERDPFGMPAPGPGRTVVVVPGTHRLGNRGAVGAAVAGWLAEVLGA
jgi:predicted alpha/beta-hydrolase family hydrolase